MGDIGLSDSSIFGLLDCKSCKCTPSHEQVLVGEDQFNSRNVDVVETDLLLANLDISSVEDNLNALVLREVENQRNDQTACSSTSNKKISQISSPNTTELLNLSKCAAILCSEVLQSCPSIFSEAESSTLDYKSSLSVRNPAKDGMSFHVQSKLVSALKGSRARQGKPLDRNLHVKWAADVYDPPVTSSSHTMKGRRHHGPPRAKKVKKEHHKHKHMKSKPSNLVSSNADRKSYQSSSSFLDPRLSRLQALPSISLQSGFRRSKMQQVLEESSCGGIIHAEPPWPFSLPVAEAS